jgi:hypothetical protein
MPEDEHQSDDEVARLRAVEQQLRLAAEDTFARLTSTGPPMTGDGRQQLARLLDAGVQNALRQGLDPGTLGRSLQQLEAKLLGSVRATASEGAPVRGLRVGPDAHRDLDGQDVVDGICPLWPFC